MTAEEWRPVVGHPAYEVSNQGRVLSHHRGRTRTLKPTVNPQNDYFYVTLCAEGARTRRTVHSLVVQAFQGPRTDGQVIRHLDGDPQNNRASNLALGSASENSYDTVRHGRHAMVNRKACPKGHVYSPENTKVYRGRRFCKTCAGEFARVEYRRRSGLLLVVGPDPLRECPQGHVMAGLNVYTYPSGSSICRTCKKAREARSRERAMLRAANVSDRAA